MLFSYLIILHCHSCPFPPKYVLLIIQVQYSTVPVQYRMDVLLSILGSVQIHQLKLPVFFSEFFTILPANISTMGDTYFIIVCIMSSFCINASTHMYNVYIIFMLLTQCSIVAL